MNTRACGTLTDTDTQSKQIHSRLGKASRLYDRVVIPVKAPTTHTHTRSFSSVQSPLQSIYKHPKSLTGLSACTNHRWGREGRREGQRKRKKTGFAMREDIRACKCIQQQRREDKEEWGDMSRRRMEALLKETWTYGLRASGTTHLSILLLCFSLKNGRAHLKVQCTAESFTLTYSK